ncbi:MAG: 50S ribosomal protein L25 [Thermodesulfobacteriota bacterium]|nr:50S ribosomal protein L25 [Thermodesulfobacteriota bacterium]
MEQLDLEVDVRDTKGKEFARRLRKAGKVPAVFYGPDEDNVPIMVDLLSFRKLYARAINENIIVNLFINKENKTEKKYSMIKDVQIHPVSRELLHVDFLKVSMDKEITLFVPLHLLGREKGEKQGKTFIQELREIQISCLPQDIPEHIEVNVSDLEVGHSVHISDIIPPNRVKIVEDETKTIVNCMSPKAEEVISEEIVAEEDAATSE